MAHMWTVLWLLWGVLFLVIELPAVKRRKPSPDTLSDHVWWYLRLQVFGVPVGVITFTSAGPC